MIKSAPSAETETKAKKEAGGWRNGRNQQKKRKNLEESLLLILLLLLSSFIKLKKLPELGRGSRARGWCCWWASDTRIERRIDGGGWNQGTWQRIVWDLVSPGLLVVMLMLMLVCACFISTSHTSAGHLDRTHRFLTLDCPPTPVPSRFGLRYFGL